VAEKTGYPKDMLDLDLDLEADLGIDTVKQAEMFAAIRSTYNIERDENLKLRDFPTLAHVIGFARDRRPDLAAAPASEPIPAQGVADPIRDMVLEIVTGQTGYPKDMLDLDLDLEADLGIDTVKQAEMFAAIRSAYNIPRDENLKLRDFPTLAHVIGFARDRAASPAPAQAEVPSRLPLNTFEAANRVPRRVPVACWRPALDFFKPTGVTLAPGTRVALMPDQGGVADALEEQLRALGVEVVRLDPAAPDSLIEAGPFQGIYWLPALDHEGSLSELDLTVWRSALEARVKALFRVMRSLYGQIANPDTFLVSATHLGGQHGYDEAGAVSPLGGAVSGFTKAYKRERTEALVKVVDFENGHAPDDLAAMLLAETRRDPGAVEIGYKNGERWTIGLREESAADGAEGLTLSRDSVFVVTGAAGSIVSAITADLASASGGTFYLLDLVPAPSPDDPDLTRFHTDKERLKRDLFARIQARCERATPALVEKELAALERAQAARAAIDAIVAAGGTAQYFSVNLTDAEAVAGVIRQVRERSGRIDVLIHAAGTERSHFLPDKDPREFDLVFDVKSNGWFNLLHAIGDMPLRATVAFSSIAGRFGNGGQTDYSAANDLLCKIASSFRTTRPATRAITIDWTAWQGIGMASRGSIPKMMELAGIDMLSPEAGIPIVRRELTQGASKGEVVIAQRLGILMDELDATGGLDSESISNLTVHGPMFGEVASLSIQDGLTIRTTLDPTVQAFLFDHQIERTPVLPGVMGIEAFAEAAATLLPGWAIDSIEDVNFLAPFKFYRSEPRTVTVQARILALGDGITAECKLIGQRVLPNQPEPQETVHFTARVHMTKQEREAPAAIAAPKNGVPVVDAGSIYQVYFHGPAYRVIERAWEDGERMTGKMALDLPDNHYPPEQPLLVAPRLIELCFQTAGLWELISQGRMGLPYHAGRVSCFGATETDHTPLFAVVRPNLEDGSFDAVVVDSSGNLYLKLQNYRTVALSGIVDTTPLKSMHPAEA
jgi:NAD(P)-dependent dehydrogenase (short-subunit alcohol dehydrogenase family)/acyl carrier protein